MEERQGLLLREEVASDGRIIDEIIKWCNF